MVAREQLIAHYTPCYANRRIMLEQTLDSVLFRSMPPHNRSDIQVFRSIMNDNGCASYYIAYLASIHHDRLMLGVESLDRVVCVSTCPPLYHKVVKSAFFVHTIKVKEPIAVMLSKVIPCKCRTRMFHDVLEGLFKAPSAVRIAKARNNKERQRLLQVQRDKRELETTSRNWTLASLLGGYEHVTPSTRPSGNMRKLLYSMFSSLSSSEVVDSSNCRERPCYLWFYGLTRSASRVLNFAIRDYLVHAIDDIPALKRQLGSLFDVDEFKKITISTMNTVRSWFRDLDPDRLKETFANAWTIQNDASITLTRRMKKVAEFPIFAEMSALVAQGHARILRIAYDGSQTSLEHTLKSNRGAVPLRALSVSDKIISKYSNEEEEKKKDEWSWLDGVGEDEEEDEEEEDEDVKEPPMKKVKRSDPDDPLSVIDSEDEWEAGQKHREDVSLGASSSSSSDEYLDNEQEDSDDAQREEDISRVINPILEGYTSFISKRFARRDQRKAISSQRKTTGLVLDRYLSQSHIEALSRLCDAHVIYHTKNHLDYVTADTITVCITAFETFGVDKSTIERILKLCGHIRKGDYSGKDTTVQLRSLKRTQPYAYSLLQGSVDIVKNAQRVLVMSNLTVDVTNHQIQALSNRFRFTRTLPVLMIEEKSCYLYYCNGCFNIFSLVRDFNSPFKQRYSFGYREIYFNYEEGDAYCSTKKSVLLNSTHNKCHLHALCKIPLLGRLVRFTGKFYLLCPNCSAVMVLDPTNCAVTTKGPVCCTCTEALVDSRIVTKTKLLQWVGIPDDQCAVKCLKCDKELSNSDTIFIYTPGIFLCSRHHSPYIAKAMDEYLNYKTDNTVKDVRRFLLIKLKERTERASRMAMRNNKGRAKRKRPSVIASSSSSSSRHHITNTSAAAATTKSCSFSYLKRVLTARKKRKTSSRARSAFSGR